MNTLKTTRNEIQALILNFHYRKEMKVIASTMETLQPQSSLKTTWFEFARRHPYQTETAIYYLKETLPLLVETHCFEVDPYHKFLFQQRYWNETGKIQSKQHYQKCAAQLTKILIVMRHYPISNSEQMVTKFVKEKQGPTCF